MATFIKKDPSNLVEFLSSAADEKHLYPISFILNKIIYKYLLFEVIRRRLSEIHIFVFARTLVWTYSAARESGLTRLDRIAFSNVACIAFLGRKPTWQLLKFFSFYTMMVMMMFVHSKSAGSLFLHCCGNSLLPISSVVYATSNLHPYSIRSSLKNTT